MLSLLFSFLCCPFFLLFLKVAASCFQIKPRIAQAKRVKKVAFIPASHAFFESMLAKLPFL